MTVAADTVSVEEFALEAHRWLAGRRAPRRSSEHADAFDVAVFHSLPRDDELALVRAASAWQAEKVDGGYGAITWPVEQGGAGLTPRHLQAFMAVEERFDTPADHELRRITVNLVAPTLAAFGQPELVERVLPQLLRCEQTACQLFSEPGAGSDLAGLSTRAAPDGSDWVVNGSKVWVSGAQFADWGVLIARSDPGVPKHAGLIAFLLPMASAGVEVRPIRQMSGGSSFNEVFLTDVRVPDALRLGERTSGWQVTLAMLGLERAQSGSKSGVGGSWEQLHHAARQRKVNPVVRQQLVGVYTHERLRHLTRLRAAQADRAGRGPGPAGSMGKLLWSQGLTKIGDAAAAVLQAELVADDGSPRAFAWGQHVLGAPGFRIAGGSDEIQRNIIGERLLGLDREPRVGET